MEKAMIYEAVFEEGVTTGITAISFVEKPAIRHNFVKLSDVAQNIEVKFQSVDPYRYEVSGAVLVPNKLIIRFSEDGKPYYIKFSEETIRKIRDNMMRKKLLDETNIQHDSSSNTKKNYLVEAYIISDDLNNTKLNLPKGSLVATYKVDKETFENEVLTEKVKGFSLEGNFDFKEAKEEEPTNLEDAEPEKKDEIETIISEILS